MMGFTWGPRPKRVRIVLTALVGLGILILGCWALWGLLTLGIKALWRLVKP